MFDDLTILYHAVSRDYFVGLYVALSFYGLASVVLGLGNTCLSLHGRNKKRTRQVRRSQQHN